MVRFENVSRDYGSFKAVKELNLRIPAGECFGFLGPNGAGKTTTLKMLAGLLIPTTGKIFVVGHDVQQEPLKAKQEMAFVPDKPFIYDKLTGREFLDFILDIYGFSQNGVRQEREELLELFSLAEWQDELLENYSHGMKQKLIITGAFIHEPKLLVIDEPMVGLDPYGHKLVKELFRKFVAGGNSIFLSTHQLSVAQEICDRISIIDHGKVVATGSVDELKKTASIETGQLESIFLKLTDKP